MTTEPLHGPTLIQAARTLDGRFPVRSLGTGIAALLPSVLHGSPHAFADLCDMLLDELYGYVYACTGDAPATQCLVEQICTVASRRVSEVGMPGFDATVWLLGIARQELHEHFGEPYQVRIGVRPGEPADLTLVPLKRLSTDQQECLMLRLWLRLSSADVAQIMGLDHPAALILQASALIGMNGER